MPRYKLPLRAIEGLGLVELGGGPVLMLPPRPAPPDQGSAAEKSRTGVTLLEALGEPESRSEGDYRKHQCVRVAGCRLLPACLPHSAPRERAGGPVPLEAGVFGFVRGLTEVLVCSLGR